MAGSAAACAISSCGGSPASTSRRRACCAWPRRPGATSAIRCCRPRRGCRSPTCVNRCARRSSTASSSPTRRRGSFRFRHALLAEAIYATILPGEREELHARLAEELARATAASPPSSRRTGRRRAARRGARRIGRSGAPGGGRLRPSRGSRASRAGARAVGRRPGRGRAHRDRSRRALRLDGRARQPDRCLHRARSSSPGERSNSSATEDPRRAALLHVHLGEYL